MIDSIVNVGDKLHIITRRQFEDDLRRHLVGMVTVVTGDLYEIEGYAFVFDSGRNEYRRQPELRRRILGLSESAYIVNRIPSSVDIAAVEYRLVDGELVATSGSDFELNINEFGPKN
jgi:hypothetical protein